MKILVPILFFSFCTVVPTEIISNFRSCYNGQESHFDTLIRLDGYYSGNKGIEKYGEYSILLFNDGSIADNIMINPNNGEVIDNKLLHRQVTDWGIYNIIGDLLISQTIRNRNTKGAVETRYKIINDTILKLLDIRGLNDGSYLLNDSNSDFYIHDIKFIKLVNKPDSLCWLKEKEWFWCDKEKYKEYMVNLKKKKN